MSDVLVRAVSDTHGELPEILECDLLVIAGDVCPATNHQVQFQREWIENEFADWLYHVPAQEVVWIAGNHDFVMETVSRSGSSLPGRRRLSEEERAEMLSTLPPWSCYLQDGWTIAQGLKVYGIPWSLGPDVSGWAFEAQEKGMGPRYEKVGAVDMSNVVADIPEDADIVAVHGPVSGFGDRVGGELSFVDVWLGSNEMLNWLRVHEPQLCVYGHNHEGYGRWDFDGKDGRGMTLANVSYLTDTYTTGEHPVMEFTLQRGTAA